MSDSSSPIKMNIELLTRDNWVYWSREVKSWMYVKDIWQVVNDGDVDLYKAELTAAGSDDDKKKTLLKKNYEAVALILHTIDRSLKPLVINYDTASEMWQALKKELYSKNAMHKLAVLNQWRKLEYDGGSISEYIMKFDAFLRSSPSRSNDTDRPCRLCTVTLPNTVISVSISR
jgi:hypothetical protein